MRKTGKAVFHCHSPSVDRMIAMSEETLFGILENIRDGRVTAGSYIEGLRVYENFKIVATQRLNKKDFAVFANNLQDEYDFISKHSDRIGWYKETWHCLAIATAKSEWVVLISLNPKDKTIRHIAKVTQKLLQNTDKPVSILHGQERN